ncbi:hypothetical protein AWB71_00155 [Caballeronia peredens]|nr:hypothetical protein AWB71_00155 [Caballeronia peredens]
MLKRAIFLVVVANMFPVPCVAGNGSLSGEWEYIEHVAGSNKPYSNFQLNLSEGSNGTVTGSYCFITQNGNRIDCDLSGVKNIHGDVEKDGRHANVQFNSFLGAKAGLAYLNRYDNILTWKVIKNPIGDFFYGPYSVTLKRKQSNMYQGERQVVVDKAYLYPAPAETTAKSYLVKGDFVKLISISDDLKFWRILYSVKNGSQIERWINCEAINFCP